LTKTNWCRRFAGAGRKPHAVKQLAEGLSPARIKGFACRRRVVSWMWHSATASIGGIFRLGDRSASARCTICCT
jgi:hypothetical protein